MRFGVEEKSLNGINIAEWKDVRKGYLNNTRVNWIRLKEKNLQPIYYFAQYTIYNIVSWSGKWNTDEIWKIKRAYFIPISFGVFEHFFKGV